MEYLNAAHFYDKQVLLQNYPLHFETLIHLEISSFVYAHIVLEWDLIVYSVILGLTLFQVI